MLATVELHTGRWCLMIAGLVLAVEADPCREWTLAGATWNKHVLEQAATGINKALSPARAGEDGMSFEKAKASVAIEEVYEPPTMYVCEDCTITRHISELRNGCPQCGETMVPARATRDQPLETGG